MRSHVVVKSIFVLLVALVPLGCEFSTAGSVYDSRDTPYEAGASHVVNGATNSDAVDAEACTVQGNASLTGGSFAAKDAIEIFDPTKAKFTFLITDYASACAPGAGIHAGSNVIAIEYDATELAGGTYDVTQTANLHVSSKRYDSACRATETVTAQSGTIKFDKLECGGQGTFDLVIGGSHVMASFTASVCSEPIDTATCK